MAYSPQTGLVYLPVMDLCQQVQLTQGKPEKGKLYLGGEVAVLGEGAYGLLEAIEVKSGESKWQYRTKYPLFASVLTTGGGLVLTGDGELVTSRLLS
jgi:alcohol dehydrogenase (cytochrome c)